MTCLLLLGPSNGSQGRQRWSSASGARPLPARTATRAAARPLFLLALSATGCVGNIIDPREEAASFEPGARGAPGGPLADVPGTGAVTPAASNCPSTTATATTGPSVLRRLSNLEYQLTLQDLFRLDQPPELGDLPADNSDGGFRTISALQVVSPEHVRSYGRIAERLVDDLWRAPTRRRAVLGCEPAAAGCIEGVADRFGKWAFRRPLELAERAALTDRAKKVASSTDDQIKFALQALLSSPSFLFRVEIGDSRDGLGKLTGHELASRLSFTLWGRGPSDALLARAERGELDRPDGLTRVAGEMLADPRVSTFYRAFFRQWLGFDGVGAPSPVPTTWSDTLLAQIVDETDRLIADFAWADKSFLDILVANYTYVSPALAKFYGLDAPAQMSGRIEFAAGHPRRGTGVLTHPSLLMAKSDGDPIAIRGNWTRGAFLCETLHVPDGLLEAQGDKLKGLSYIEMLGVRNAEAACATCHKVIDPVGVAFVQYDSIGRHDPNVRADQYPIKPRLEGAQQPEFSTIADLARKLKEVPAVASCMAEQVFVYSFGRHPEAADRCELEVAGKRFVTSGATFRALLAALVEAPSFRLRRAPMN